jgi:hypothetical protein
VAVGGKSRGKPSGTLLVNAKIFTPDDIKTLIDDTGKIIAAPGLRSIYPASIYPASSTAEFTSALWWWRD